MKYFIYGTILGLMIMFITKANAADCTDVQQKTEVQEEQVITTDVPSHLKDGFIIIVQKDGKQSTVSTNNFKVVPRKQQRLVTKVKESTERTCKVSGKEKNLLMVGGRRDHKDLDIQTNGKTAIVESERGLVLDATYLRQNIFDSKLGLGAGVDTNGTLRGVIGIEF